MSITDLAEEIIDAAVALGFYDGLRPEPRLTVSEWADLHRYLDSKSSSEPGKWRTSRVPYMRALMDDLSVRSAVEELIFQKGAQVAGTEAGFNWLGYIIDIAPGPSMLVMPTIDTAKRNSKTRFDPMISATPRLREKIPEARSRDSGNTVFQKDFPGGTLVITGANSAAGLRSMPVRNLFLDEVDAYPLDLEGEGSPVDLAEARTRTFAKRKKFLCSTPKTQGTSVINKYFLATDQRKYHVPCPHCGHKQHLIFENLLWEKGQPETAQYYCESCGAGIEERFKTTMFLEKGYGGEAEWIPTVPANITPKKKGYHINSLYSPFGWHSWAQMAEDYEDALGDVTAMKAFINTQLGEPYAEETDAPDWERLYNRRSAYQINKPPKEVIFITVGVDVQKDRLELEIVGFSQNRKMHSIDYRVLFGETSEMKVWNDLALVVNETWEREDGSLLPMQRMAVDAGYNTNMVYDFCRRFDATRVIPVLGRDSQDIMVSAPRAVDVSASGKKIGKLKCWHVATGMIKSELYGYLRQEIGEDGTIPKGFCFFPQYDQHYFKMLTAEVLKKKINKRGYPEYKWTKVYERNEALDCRVYARAAAYVVGIDRHGEKPEFWAQFTPLSSGEKRESKKRPPREGSFWP